MFNKKIILLLTIILVSLLAVSTVNAEDNVTSDVVGAEETADDIVCVEENQTIEQIYDEEIIGVDDGTFTALQEKINKASEGSTINLENDYVYDEGFNNSGICIDKSLNINGKGFKINANGNSRIFNITGNNVSISRLTFVNAHVSGQEGGAIYWSGDYGRLSDSTFENNVADAGGAITWVGYGGYISGSTFNRNNITGDDSYGGAIHVDNDNLTIIDSTFYKNYALGDSGDAGAISVDAYDVKVLSCYFERNYASNVGGAIYWSGGIGVLKDSKFINDYANGAGALCHTGFDSIVSNCTFEDCYSIEGGAVRINYDGINFDTCIFKNNYAEYRGGAIFVCVYGELNLNNCKFYDNYVESRYGYHGGAIYSATYEKSIILDSIFVNNSAPYQGGAIYLDDDGQSRIDNCIFKDNEANYGAAITIVCEGDVVSNSTFSDNHARCSAADVYWRGSDGILDNCNFIGSSASEDGGSVYWAGVNGILSNSSFENCFADFPYDGGAVYWTGNNGTLTNSKFTNNSALLKGGAIKWNGNNGHISDSTFKDNTAPYSGGAIDVEGTNVRVERCIFENSSAILGGAVKWDGEKGALDRSTFISNHASTSGGAVCWIGNKSSLTNSKFMQNVADEIGGAVYWIGDDSTLKYNRFVDNYTKHNDLIVGGNNVVVIFANVEIEAPDVRKDYGGDEKLVVTLTGTDSGAIADADVKITINGQTFTGTTDSSGKAYFDLDLNAGSYPVDILFEGNEDYSEAVETATVTVNQINSSIILSYDKTSNDSVTLIAAVTPSTATGDVVFNVNGKKHSANVSNSKSSVDLSDLEVGSYTVSAVYNGDANHKSSTSNSVSFTVEEIYPILTVNDVAKYYGGAEKLEIALADNKGNVIANVNVKVTLNGKTSIVKTDSKGQAELDLNLPVGTYDAISEYEDISANSTVTVKSTILASDASGEYSSSKVSATFLNADGNALASQQVTFKINGKDYSATTDGNGEATSNVDLGVGAYIVTAVNPANNEHKQFNLTISKANSKIALTSTQDNDAVTLTAELTPAGATGNVAFNIGGEIRNTAISNGKATLTLKVLPAGNYTVTASYDGDKNLNASTSNTVTFNVAEVYPILTANDITKTYGTANKFVVNLVDSKGNAIANAVVDVNIDNMITPITTDANGQATMLIGLAPGSYTATVTYADAMTTAKINVKKATPKLTAKAKTFKKSVKTKKYTVTLKTNQNKVMKNTKVTIKVNKKTYSAKTNSKGVATFKITKLTKKGKYTATVTYKGNAYYNKLTKNVKITVK